MGIDALRAARAHPSGTCAPASRAISLDTAMGRHGLDHPAMGGPTALPRGKRASRPGTGAPHSPASSPARRAYRGSLARRTRAHPSGPDWIARGQLIPAGSPVRARPQEAGLGVGSARRDRRCERRPAEDCGRARIASPRRSCGASTPPPGARRSGPPAARAPRSAARRVAPTSGRRYGMEAIGAEGSRRPRGGLQGGQEMGRRWAKHRPVRMAEPP